MGLMEELAAQDGPTQLTKTNGSPLPDPESPRRLRADLPYEEFPLGTLPSALRAYVEQVADSIGCDPSFAMLPLLSVLAACIGRSRDVEIKPGWWEPCIIWAACIGESASGKTPALKPIIGPLRHLEDAMLEEYQADCERILTTHAELNEGKKKSEQTEPDLPPMPRYTAADCTVEAIASVLAENPLGILLADDELSGWFASFNQYKGGKGSDRAKWLQTYDAGRLTIDRKTGVRLTIVPHASVSICGGIQPGVLRKSLSVDDYDSGLAARFIFAMPPDQVMGWSETPGPHPDRLRDVLAALLTCRNDERTVPLDAEAREVMADFKRADVIRLRGISGPLRSAWGKSAGRSARIALILHCVEAPESDFISRDEMLRAVEIVRWSDRETARIYESLGVATSPDAELLEFVRERGEVTPRDLMNWKRKRFPRSDIAELELIRLAEAGLLTRSVRRHSGPGRQTDVFRSPTPDTEHGNA